MAEGWARKWVKDEKEMVLTRQAKRLNGLVDELSEFNSVFDDRLLTFLDSLLVHPNSQKYRSWDRTHLFLVS
jgi:cell division protein ZapA (FtsZ GTPase activity inhibitor)